MKPNENFNISVRDLEIIENSLKKEISRLLNLRKTYIESTITPEGEITRVKEIDCEIKEINDLLGKFHNQKEWYRPKDKIYVSG